jgi:hypothetical protein
MREGNLTPQPPLLSSAKGEGEPDTNRYSLLLPLSIARAMEMGLGGEAPSPHARSSVGIS